MTSTFTPNLGLELPGNGDYNNTWNIPLNSDYAVIDTATGGNTTINVVGASGIIALTTTQYRNRVLIFLGVLTANVNYQVPTGVGGIWVIANATSGTFTLTISSGGGGASIVVPQGFTESVYSAVGNIGRCDTISPTLTGGGASGNWNITAANAINAGSTSYAVGYLQAPRNLQSSAYTAIASDAGKCIVTNGSVTINAGVFSIGDAFLINNNTVSNLSIIQGTATLRLAGTITTGTRTLLPYGIASIYCPADGVFIVTGNIS